MRSGRTKEVVYLSSQPEKEMTEKERPVGEQNVMRIIIIFVTLGSSSEENRKKNQEKMTNKTTMDDCYSL